MIYTTGYYGHQPEALKALADALDATVVDIRFMPASRVPGWRKQALQKLLGDRYLWVQAFGNIHYNDGQPIQIADMAAGVKALIKHGQRNYDPSAESPRTLVVGWIAAMPTGIGRSLRTRVLLFDILLTLLYNYRYGRTIYTTTHKTNNTPQTENCGGAEW